MKTLTFIKNDLIIWILILLPFVFLIFTWNQLPQVIPTKWNFNGEVILSMEKGYKTFFIPVLNLAIYFLLIILPIIDPKKENYSQFGSAFYTIRLLVHALLSIVFVMILLSALHYPINMSLTGKYLLPAIFIILGNFMGKIRPNYFVGIRTPWTLANEDVWVKTHRMAGWVWVVCSLIYLMASFFTQLPQWIQLTYIAVLIVVPFVYSFVKFKQLTGEK